MAASQDHLIRKQYLVSREQAKKVEKIARSNGSSAAEIVRMAIDAYDPDIAPNGGEHEILQLALDQVQGAIKLTQGARRRLKRTRTDLSRKHQ